MKRILSIIAVAAVTVASGAVFCGCKPNNEGTSEQNLPLPGTGSYSSFYFDDFFYPKKIILSQPYGTGGMSWEFDRSGRYSYEEVKQIREELGDNKGGYRDERPNAPYICRLTSINISCEDKWYGIEPGETWNPYVKVKYETYANFDSIPWPELPTTKFCSLADVNLSDWDLVGLRGNIEFDGDHTPPQNSVFVLTLTGKERTITCRFMYNPSEIIILDE